MQTDNSTPPGPDAALATPGAAAASQSSPQTDTGQTAATPPARPDWLPETFWDAAKNEPKGAEFKEHLSGLEKLKADVEARRGAIPGTPDAYKFVPPPDVKLPAGYEPSETDPKFVGLRQIAHEEGLSQEAVNKIVRLEAEALVAADARIKGDILARDTALGENGAARVAALAKFIESHWADPKEATQIKATLWTPVIVKHFEKFQQMLSSQGAHSLTGIGRDDKAGKDAVPDGWEKWSPVDRRTYQLERAREAAASGRH